MFLVLILKNQKIQKTANINTKNGKALSTGVVIGITTRKQQKSGGGKKREIRENGLYEVIWL